MKAQLFASAALVLLNAIPGALSAKVSRHLTLTSLSNDFCVMFAHVLTHLLIRLPSHHTSLQPQLRGVILATDFEDQLALYDPKDEDLSEDFDFEATEPYEEDDFDSSDFDKMEPYDEGKGEGCQQSGFKESDRKCCFNNFNGKCVPEHYSSGGSRSKIYSSGGKCAITCPRGKQCAGTVNGCCISCF